jgi:hypothetical protein
MAFVHSLIRTEAAGKTGWRAPLEIGEAAPHYVSFMVPIDTRGRFLQGYTCETVITEAGTKRTEAHQLVRHGKDTFLLRIDKTDLWFVVWPVRKDERRLPYVGKLEHPDFALRFTEIEPEKPELLDKLYDERNICVIGCEPFTHYVGVKPATYEAAT